MNADDGRPIGVPRMSTDYDEWLAYHDTPAKIQMAVSNCLAWIDACEKGTNPLDRVRGIKYWQHRLTLLRTKALLMGITLEE